MNLKRSQIYRNLNNYDYSNLEDIKTYVLKGILPTSLKTEHQKQQFIKKFGQNWKVNKDCLIFEPFLMI